ncbi:MAG: class IV adenylate cyclase [Candidatus Komeilibacteria bacterium]|nr:class IV adenylate cyclase [Candidatus Komeilibacteria bacterium]
MKNLEIKARIGDISQYKALCRQIGARRIWTKKQIDTYFKVPKGRLKLREEGSQKNELIYYQRREGTNKRWSDYDIAPVSRPAAVKRLLGKAYGIAIVVDKKRLLYQYKNARIHLDEVRHLGSFLEIEIVVKKDELQAKALMRTLLDALGLPQDAFIKESYSDLLHKRKNRR